MGSDQQWWAHRQGPERGAATSSPVSQRLAQVRAGWGGGRGRPRLAVAVVTAVVVVALTWLMSGRSEGEVRPDDGPGARVGVPVHAPGIEPVAVVPELGSLPAGPWGGGAR